MSRNELAQIHSRFFNSPEPISVYEMNRYNKNLANRKPSKRPGTVVFTGGTFVGNVRQTFKF